MMDGQSRDGKEFREQVVAGFSRQGLARKISIRTDDSDHGTGDDAATEIDNGALRSRLERFARTSGRLRYRQLGLRSSQSLELP